MGHNTGAEIYIGKRSPKKSLQSDKMPVADAIYIPKENKWAALSSEIKLSNALQAIRGGKKFKINIFSLKYQENTFCNVCIQLSKSICESWHSSSRQGEKVYTEKERHTLQFPCRFWIQIWSLFFIVVYGFPFILNIGFWWCFVVVFVVPPNTSSD